MLKNLETALKVIKYFTHETPSWGIRDLAKVSGINHTTVYRILETMKNNDFLIKNPETKKYSLGVVFWELGTIMRAGLNVNQLIRPVLEQLCEKTEESVFLTVIDGQESMTLLAVEPQNRVKFSAFEGSRAPLHAGASYRSILAFQSEELISTVLAQPYTKYTAKTILDKKGYLAEIERIKQIGYAISYGEYTEDVVAVAMPIKDASGNVTASLTISGPNYRFTDRPQQKAIELLMKEQKNLEKLLKIYDIYFT